LTGSFRPIPALLDKDAYSIGPQRPRILLIAGLSGMASDVLLGVRALQILVGSDASRATSVVLNAIPCANPEGLELGLASDNGAGGNPAGGYPPENDFYHNSQDPEAHYLWRWVSYLAPDLVLEIKAGGHIRWENNDAGRKLAPAVGAVGMRDPGSLLAELGKESAGSPGSIPGLRLIAPESLLSRELTRLVAVLADPALQEASNARQALEARCNRPPLEVAAVLAAKYGHALDPLNYTQGVAISGRLRLDQLNGNSSSVPGIVAMLKQTPLASSGPFGGQPSTAAMAGVVWATELAEATGDQTWADLLVRAANLYEDIGPGQAPPPSDPDFRTEDMFMNAALLGRAYRVTGHAQYIDLLTRFLKDSNIQQDNGLFWHCRSAPYLWGRGNGFAALGLAEALTDLPDDHPDRPAILSMHRSHLESLTRYQQPSGMYLQVLDIPGSYQEFTSTCMIGYAMARGLRLGWLDSSFSAPLQLAWQGVAQRIDYEGNVVDACMSTGVQASIEDYLSRPAVSGFDDRSGGMALWFAVEVERLARQT
jgi:rhamnogalacturonyl hydrolase YesR